MNKTDPDVVEQESYQKPITLTVVSHTQFEVDWDKVKNLDDLKRLLSAFNIRFCGERSVASIGDLVKEVK